MKLYWSRSILIGYCSHCARVEKHHIRVFLVCLANLCSVLLINWWQLKRSGMEKWWRAISSHRVCYWRLLSSWSGAEVSAGWVTPGPDQRPESGEIIHFHFLFLDRPTWVDADGTAQPVQQRHEEQHLTRTLVQFWSHDTVRTWTRGEELCKSYFGHSIKNPQRTAFMNRKAALIWRWMT